MKKLTSIALLGCTLGGSTVALAGAPAPAAPKKTPELLAKGKTAFTTYCVPCHGDTGEGNGAAASALNPKPRNFKVEQFKFGTKPEEVFKTIATGSPGTAMTGWPQLSEQDRWALAYYVLSFRPDQGAAAKTKGKGKK